MTFPAGSSPVACRDQLRQRPDTYEVESAPDGFLIVPQEAEIAEEATGEFVIYRAEGS